ncbi:MAG: alanine racemase [Bacteroidales bacterium]|nr:alanine racemase [Bacteroidales bacterium]
MKIKRPTLLIDPDKSRNNLRKMEQKARRHGLIFRPHFKTHQSRKIGQWFKESGIDKITVSSVEMARYFAADGWKDITIAFPLNIHEINEINALAGKINLHVTLLNPESLEALRNKLEHPAGVFLKIDTGAQRTGIPWNHTEEVIELARQIKQIPNLHLEGLLAHAGHTYHARSREETLRIHRQTRDRLVQLRNELQNNGEDILISVGDTPSASLAEAFDDIDEIRPGNFIFYDLQQYKLDACSIDDIAISLACPVVARHKERGQVVVYGGAVHLSKDSFIEGSRRVYGYGMIINEEGWIVPEEKIIVAGLSQEHGILNVTPYMMKRIAIGDFIGILPSHSCLTANLMGEYYDIHGERYDHMNG